MQMARELDAILDHGEAHPASNFTNEDGVVSYLEQVICPIYKIMQEVSKPCALWLYLYTFSKGFGNMKLVSSMDQIFIN